MPMRLTGKPALSYKGVEAVQPPNIVESKTIGTFTARQPTVNDYYEFNEGDLWMVNRGAGAPVPYELWYLAGKAGTALGVQAYWRQLYPVAGGGGGNLRSDDLVIETPDPATGAINVYGGEPYGGNPIYTNIYTKQLDPADPYTLAVCLKRSIFQPMTNVTATEGMYSLGEHNFLFAYGTNNTACGIDALNLTLNAVTCQDSTAIGFAALRSIDDGAGNTAVGSQALNDVISGSDNIGIGYLAGDSYTSNESDNIIIGNLGVLGDQHTIRIGIMGVGAAEQNKCVVAGIWNGTDDPAKNNGIVNCDEDGMLYVADIDDNSIVCTGPTGRCQAMKGPVGTVLTGHGILPGDPRPEFLPLESAGGSVAIAVNPITGAINLEAAGVAALTQLTSDTGPALPLAGNINVFGGELINTDNLVANTVTVNLDQGANDSVVAGSGIGTASVYKQLASSDGSIVFNFTNPLVIDMVAVGGGGGGLTHLLDDAGAACAPVAGGIQIVAGDNIETHTLAPGQIEVRVTDSVELPSGHLLTRDYIETTAGNLIADAGNLVLPATNGAGTAGEIVVGGNRWISSYGVFNTFVGRLSGNTAVTGLYNTGIGNQSLEVVTTGESNTAIGAGSLLALTSGIQNVCLGNSTAYQIKLSNYNLCLGWHAGYNLTDPSNSNIYLMHTGIAGESNTMRLGVDGVGARNIDATYVAGIYGRPAGPVAQMVVCGSDGKLSTSAIPGGGILTLGADAGGPAVPVGGQINVLGGYNTGTRAAGNNIYVDLDGSIQQDTTKATGEGIYALGVRGANTYIANRFMHNYGTACTWLGYQAGPITLPGATSCVGIGTNALDAAAGAISATAVGRNALTNGTTSSYCTALGSYSGDAVTTGQRNLMVGYKAGTNYTTESYNIILGGLYNAPEASTAGDTRVMRLGYKTLWDYVVDPHNPDGIFTKTQTGTDDTYIYGIYNSTLDPSALPVYCDKYGKVGTTGNVMFAYRQTSDLVNVTGDASVYSFGTAGGITVDFDNTNALGWDGAAGASNFIFTAPYAGKYLFCSTIVISVPASPPVPRVVSRDPLWLVTSQLDYCFSSYIPASTTAVQYISEIVTAIVYLDAGDTARFACAVGALTDVKNISIRATLTAPIVPVGVGAANGTHFYGYRIG